MFSRDKIVEVKKTGADALKTSRSSVNTVEQGENLPVKPIVAAESDDGEKRAVARGMEDDLKKSSTTLRLSKDENIRLQALIKTLGYKAVSDLIHVFVSEKEKKLTQTESDFYNRELDKIRKQELDKLRKKKSK